MKIPFGWLLELVETEATAERVAEQLTMAGVEATAAPGGSPALDGVVVGAVEAVVPHPAGGALTVCQVSTGGDTYEVVCGAPNVRPGVRAAFAPPGAMLPGGRRIDLAVIRGTASRGMLCSETELGIGDAAAGILLLEEDAPVGRALATYLGLDDLVLEVEVTPNRPDCLSVMGVAREVAALTGGRLRPPATTLTDEGPEAATLASVQIDDPELCPRYAARVVLDVRVAPSPARLAQRLRAAGLRPINNVVDVTNYVLWELGHPLHAFDYDRLAEHRIVVRRAAPGETLVTLDGQSRRLEPTTLVIADATRAIAVAGVMGGANTEVGSDTRRVLIESAYFDPASVRRTAKALGLSTEASYRFERGADLEGLRAALDRAAGLTAALGGGRVAAGTVDAYPSPRPPVRVRLRMERVRRVLGACPAPEVVSGILGRLGFAVAPVDGTMEVAVPSFRRDVSMEDDLVEEVARVWGYHEIPSTLPSGALGLARRPRSMVVGDSLRGALAAAGLQEVVTLSMIDPSWAAAFGLEAEGAAILRLRNPLANDRSLLRPTLLPGLLEVVATNARRQMTDLRIFELGRVYLGGGADGLAREELRIGVVLSGLRAPRSWFGARARADVFDARGVVETVVQALEREGLTVEPAERSYLEVGRGAAVLVQGVRLGVIGELHPDIQRRLDLPAPVFVAELSLDELDGVPARVLAHRPLPRFPGVQRDLAVVVPAGLSAAEVGRAIRAVANPLLVRVQLFDVYSGEQVGAGRKSLAYALSYQAEDRTLTDAEVNRMHGTLVEHLRRELGVEVRGGEGE